MMIRAKKRSTLPGRNGLFRIGLHLKIIFIIANTLPKTGFYLSFILLAFKDETFAASSAANFDFDFAVLHKHPPVSDPQKRRRMQRILSFRMPISDDFNLIVTLNGSQR
jgi:hypothetical protein